MQLDLVTTALAKWEPHDELFGHFLPLISLEWPISSRGDYLETYRTRIIGAAEDYAVSRRQRLLIDYWDVLYQGIENVPHSETVRMGVPPERMEKLNAIGNLRKLPRLWWYLYSLAYVAEKLNHPNPLRELDALVDRAYIA